MAITETVTVRTIASFRSLGALVESVQQQAPRLQRWARKLGEFFLAQGLLQLLMAIGGFLLLRWMPVEDYAVFTLAFSVQSAMIAFADIGFTGAIVPLVGNRVNDPAVIGGYVAGARRLRWLLLPWVLAGGLIALSVMGVRQQLTAWTISALFVLIAVTLWFNAVSLLHAAPLLIRQDLRFLHAGQNVMGVVRVAAYAAAHAMGVLGGSFALGLNTLLNGGMAAAMFRRARPLVVEPRSDAVETQAALAEILRFVRPQVPVMIFFALQGQLLVLLVSVVGDANALAATGALSRLNLVFATAPFLLSWIVQPYFARIGASLVRRRFWQLTLAGVGILALAPAAGFLWPDPFLWLLGPHYGHLSSEVGLFLLAGATGTAASLVSTLILARRWLVADAILLIAPCTLGAQACTATLVDVATPAGAVAVTLAGNAGSLLAHVLIAVRGARRDGRRKDEGLHPKG